MAEYINVSVRNYDKEYWKYLCQRLGLPETTTNISLKIDTKNIESYVVLGDNHIKTLK